MNKFIVIKRKTIFLSAVSLVLVVVFLVFALMGSSQVFSKNKKLPIYCVGTEEKVVSLTFDAAWGCDFTQKILDILQQHQIKATFFLVSFWVEKYPDMLREIDRAEMEVGTHSKTHSHMSKQSLQKQIEELTYSSNAITSVISKPVKLFRAPFGEYNNSLLEAAEQCGIQTIQWDVDSHDWMESKSKEYIINRVLSKAKNGSIILFHNNSQYIDQVLPAIIEGLKLRGFSFKPVGQMLHTENYYIDSQGVQRKTA